MDDPRLAVDRQMGNFEVGAVRRFKGKYYLMAQTWGPYAGGTYLGNTAPGMYTFIGIFLEGTLEFQPPEKAAGRCGIFVEENAARATAVLLGTDGRTQLGPLKLEGNPAFEPDDFVEAGLTPRRKHTFRLLTRQYMLEFYLDDRLIQCYSLPERATGRIGFVAQGGRAVVGNLKAWGMTFCRRQEPAPHNQQP